MMRHRTCQMEKNSKLCRDLDLDQTMPNVVLVGAIFMHYKIPYILSFMLVFSLSYRVQPDVHTDRWTGRRHKYSVDTPQL